MEVPSSSSHLTRPQIRSFFPGLESWHPAAACLLPSQGNTRKAERPSQQKEDVPSAVRGSQWQERVIEIYHIYPSLRVSICLHCNCFCSAQTWAVQLVPGRCQVLVLDEADRMIDLGFEEEIRNTLDHYRGADRCLNKFALLPAT